jgi:glycosyltransferase involved in cell wall biosynthesis
MVVAHSPARVKPMVPVFVLPTREPDVEDVLVAIPALNEERFIGSVVHEVRLQGFECLVIDDGSSDRTSAIASAAGAIVERHERNMGKASAMNTAFEVARRTGVSTLVVMDGDWQHDPREIHDLIEPIRTDAADIVSGSRFLRSARGHVPGVRRVGMRALTIGSSVVSGHAMTDSLSGFRAFSRPAIETLRFKSHGFSVEFEMQFMARTHGLRHVEVPITARYDDAPKRNVIWYGVHAVDGLIRLAARFRPLLFFGLPSAVALLLGLLLGVVVINTYQRASEFAAGYALLTVLLIILGSIGLFAAILLHVLRGIFLDLEGDLRALTAATTGPTDPS